MRTPLRNPRKAALLAWLVPGWGHWYQGRRGKAILYAVCIIGLYVVGQTMGEWKVVHFRWTNPLSDAEHFRFAYLCQFWNGLLALPALIQATLVKWGLPTILGGFLAEPPVNELRGLEPRLGKYAEIGWIYTIVAGLLNVLAIFDALDGPADELTAAEAAPQDGATTPATSQPLAPGARV
jgi:hypothetical protein